MSNTSKITTAEYWIERLGMTVHLEGGAFKEVYRSDLVLPRNVLAEKHGGDRNAMTSIYYLLKFGEFSKFHRIASDELWHFYDGSPLHIYEITANGQLTDHVLGRNVEAGESLLVNISAGNWFSARVEEQEGFTLCGCTVAPGFDFQDFEIADTEQLIAAFPQHKGIIMEFAK